MFSKIFAVIALAATVIAQATVQTPASVVQCQPVAITFSGGTPPYFLSVIPGGQTAAAALVDFGQVQSSPYTWTVNLPAGTSITFKITDSSGVTSYSAPVTIQSGSSSACLTSSAGGSSTSAASSATGIIASGSSSASSASSAVSSATSATSAAATTTPSTVASSTSTRAASSAVSSVASRVSSAVSSASSAVSSAVASVTSKSGAQPTGIANVGAALALGLLGGAAALL